MHIHWSYGIVCAWGLMGVIAIFPAMAQITPDETLGNERSRVNRNVQVRGGNADRIEGGAARGANLFHSFSEFNVNEGQRVYFANPSGIANILSRVTGRDVSDIMGTLGVDGAANLFLLNPNGIIFGPNARLDISGSFVGSTADSFTFADGGVFSATNPGDSSLLSVNVPLGVQYGPNAPGAISNAGTLSVGQNFRLSGGSVTSTGLLSAPSGQLLVEGVAGNVQVRNAVAQTATLSASNNLFLQDSQLQTTNDLNLFAGNTVQVRDSVANPFVAYAGGNLTVQGNQNIDIFALNHPSSGLVSGGDMVLRSANTVGGDAHYWSGGNFRIEQLDGDLGNLFSPYDPVIQTAGNVEFESYEGASLQILAGGSVTVGGNITITSVEDLANGFAGRVDVADPLGILPALPIIINGTTEPTLDIRSGITVNTTIEPPFSELAAAGLQDGDGSYLDGSSGSDIQIGSVRIDPGAGQVFLQSNSGSVVFTNQDGIPTASNGNYSIVAFGSPVTISALGDVRIPQGIITGSVQGTGRANITIFSGRTIDTTNNGTTSGRLTSFVNFGDSGNITLRAIGGITTGDISSRVLRIRGRVGTGTGFGGSINIESREDQVQTGAIESSTSNTGSTEFSNASITITAQDNITTGNISSRVIEIGFPGAIELTSTNGRLIQTGIVEASTQNTGSVNFRNPDITITANEGNIWTGALRSFVGTYDDSADESIGGSGNAGNISLIAPNGFINVNGRIASFTGAGTAGDISLDAGGDVEIFSARSFVGNYDTSRNTDDNPRGGIQHGIGDAGDITITSATGNITLNPNGPRDLLAFSSNSNFDNFSEIALSAEQGSVILNRAVLTTSNPGSGFAGVITIDAGDRVVIRNSRLESQGYAGYIIVQAPSEVRIINSRLDATSPSQQITNPDFVSTVAVGSEGRVILNGSSLTTTNTTDSGTTRDTAGDVVVTAGRGVSIRDGFLRLPGEEQSALSSEGYFGRVFVGSVPDFNENDSFLQSFENRFSRVVPRRILIDSATVTSNTTTAVVDEINRVGVGGVRINARDSIRIRNGSQVTAATLSQNWNANDGGNINITTRSFRLTANDRFDLNQTLLRASTFGQGDAGNITIQANNILLDNAVIFNNAESGSTGNAGNITIGRDILELTGAQIQAIVRGVDNKETPDDTTDDIPAGQGDGGIIDIRANEVSLSGTSSDGRTSFSSAIFTAMGLEATGTGGNIRITADSLRLRDGASLNAQASNRNSTAGSITIGTDQFDLQNSSVTVSNERGEAGSLSITAGPVILDNSSLTAIAGRGDGGNIDLTTSATLLRLQNEDQEDGLISARAVQGADGGRITLNVEDGFVLANPYENSDIIASAAEGGDGGRIQINTYAIFGLEERDPLTELSDINASSEFGTDGEIILSTLGIDPTRGLGELSIETLDAADQVVEGCIGRNPSTDSDVEQGEFSQTGRGGLSPDPTAPLTGETLIDQLATLDEDLGQADANVSAEGSSPQLIEEAQGLEQNPDGSVTLVANSLTTPSPYLPGVPPNRCDAP